MNWILLFSFSALLCCALTGALKCRVCRLISGCPSGKAGTCETLPGEQCITEKVIKEGVRKFLTRGCTLPGDACGITRQDADWGTVTKECCSDHDFCNDGVGIPTSTVASTTNAITTITPEVPPSQPSGSKDDPNTF